MNNIKPTPKPKVTKRGPGRPKSTIARQKLTVTLPPDVIAQLVEIGEGLPSRGIEKLLQAYNLK